MKAEVKKIITGIVAILLCGLIPMAAIAGLYWLMFSTVLDGSNIPHKSDEELIANFQTHRDEFEKLLRMIAEDQGLERVDVNWTDPKNPQTVGVSQDRVGEYRALCKKIGVPRGFYAFHDKCVFKFISSAQGLSISGSSKGYIYSGEPLNPVVDNLDEYIQFKEKPYSFSTYRHIEGNWYLFFEAN